jgi:lipopolysaccharide/colanic/teichoic acid biosynthesis glycosyltransferase
MTYALPNLARVTNAGHYSATLPIRQGLLRPFSRVRYQFAGGILIAVVLPALIRGQFDLRVATGSLENTVLGTAAAMLAAAYVLRRMLPYPGVRANSFILPAFTATYAIAAMGLLFFRIDYSRFQLFASFLLAVPWFVFVLTVEKYFKRPLLAVVPIGNIRGLTELAEADCLVLEQPEHVPVRASGVVADLRASLPPEWEKLLASSALKGLPVYHSKHVVESLTGRVEIEHLSENSLGSLLPSSIYLKFKRLLDTLGVLIALPLILPIGFITAFLIKLEDRGPIFFTQPRMGFGGKMFTILKFRTMRTDARGEHFTEGDDPRVTRIGKFLRRYRIDELPQVVNILRGEMSWIGPRPESLTLSEWYEAKIPFYSYRHIVRPGITGWAQVQQGYAAKIAAVTGKLHYDFFYIKHFSPWLDLLIVARTIRTILTGFGAR